MLSLVGAGLGGLNDLTLKGFTKLKTCEKIYLDTYTSIHPDLNRAVLFKRFGVPVLEADRTMVESESDGMLEEALRGDICFLVVGDPLAATTHADLYLRAIERGVTVDIIHNSSIMTAVGSTGLQLYRFGQTVSIPFFEGNWKPSSFMDKIEENIKLELHSLVLLDIKVKEQSVENIIAQKPIYEPPRFMSINQAISQILDLKSEDHHIDENTLACGIARLGSPTQLIVFGDLKDLRHVDFGPPLHSLIICAPHLHDIEKAFAFKFSNNKKMNN